MKDGKQIRDRERAQITGQHGTKSSAKLGPSAPAPEAGPETPPPADDQAKVKEFLPRFEENDAGEVIGARVKLRYPKDVRQWLPDVGTLTEVHIGEITMEERRQANRAKRPGDSELDDEMMLMSIVTKLPFEVVSRLNSRDYNTIQMAMGRLFF